MLRVKTYKEAMREVDDYERWLDEQAEMSERREMELLFHKPGMFEKACDAFVFGVLCGVPTALFFLWVVGVLR